MGKMLHQLITANYYHLTHGDDRRPLRRSPAPGHHSKPLPQPGFRWNILDYGGGGQEEIDYKRLSTMAGNVFSRPLAMSKRCSSVRGAWHCLWQRFPGQTLRPSPVISTPVSQAAHHLYNLSLEGKRHDGMVQYLVASAVANVFTQVTPMTRKFLAEHLQTRCNRGGPYCGGTAAEQRTPIAAVHQPLHQLLSRTSYSHQLLTSATHTSHLMPATAHPLLKPAAHTNYCAPATQTCYSHQLLTLATRTSDSHQPLTPATRATTGRRRSSSWEVMDSAAGPRPCTSPRRAMRSSLSTTSHVVRSTWSSAARR